MTTAPVSAVEKTKLFIFRGFQQCEIKAGDFVETNGFVSIPNTGEVFRLGDSAFYDEKEAREAARARMQAFCL